MLTADYLPGATFGPRTLSDHEFVWLLRGSARWQVWPADGAAVGHELRPGQLALGYPGQRDRFDWDANRPSRHRFVHFRLTGAGPARLPADAPQVRSFEELPLLAALCQFLSELAVDPSERARRRTDELLAVLLDLFVHEPTPPDRRPAADRPTDPLTPVWDVVAADWAEHGLRIIDVDALAAAAGMSRGHLFRLFRQQFGCGPARALELVRLARAATALQRSNGSLASVAAAAGFANAYHFSRRFTAVFGCPPGEFRRSGDGIDPTTALRSAGLLAVAQRLG